MYLRHASGVPETVTGNIIREDQPIRTCWTINSPISSFNNHPLRLKPDQIFDTDEENVDFVINVDVNAQQWELIRVNL